METTITLECTLETHAHLKELEHELKQIHGLKVFYVEPRDADAPVLISISVLHQDEQAELAIRRIAHTLFDFVHNTDEQAGQRKLMLVTIEGERIDIEPLSNDELWRIIDEAHAGQAE